MRNPTKSRDAAIQLAASLFTASRWIGREVARMVTAQLLRRLAAYERSQRCSQVKFPKNAFPDPPFGG
jgi:hypothetical protein